MELVGRLHTHTAPKIELEVNKYLERHNRVLDLGQTTFVTSAGLRIFLITTKKLIQTGGYLRICNLNEIVSRTF